MSEHPDTWHGRTEAMRERLQAAFPKVFPRDRKSPDWRPLAVGIREAIAQRLALTDPRDLSALKAALASHCRSGAYDLCLLKIPHRFDLDGKACGTVSDTERAQAKERLKAKQAKARQAKASKASKPRKPAAPTGKPTPNAAPVVIRKSRKAPNAQKAVGGAKG